MGEVIVRVVYGDFYVNGLPSSAVDLQTLNQIHGAVMLASMQKKAMFETEKNTDDVLKDFPVVCLEWGKEVDYQRVVKIPAGEYRVNTDPDPRIVAFIPTGSPRGVSFPVSFIPGSRARQKMYDKEHQRPVNRHQSVWDSITRAIEVAFDRADVIVRKEESGETTVNVVDRESGVTIVWYRFVQNRKIAQGGTCLSGSERTLSPFAVVAAYYQMLDTGRTVADGVVMFQ